MLELFCSVLEIFVFIFLEEIAKENEKIGYIKFILIL